MQTKHLCVLIHIRIICEVSTMKQFKPSSNFLTGRSKVVLLLWICFVICVCLCHTDMSVSCSRVATCWERADLGSLVCDVFLRFSHFPIWRPVSGVVVDCIDSRSLHFSLLYLAVGYLFTHLTTLLEFFPYKV